MRHRLQYKQLKWATGAALRVRRGQTCPGFPDPDVSQKREESIDRSLGSTRDAERSRRRQMLVRVPIQLARASLQVRSATTSIEAQVHRKARICRALVKFNVVAWRQVEERDLLKIRL